MLCSIEFKPADTDSLACLHSDRDAGRERRLPRKEESVPDVDVLLDARVGDLLPCSRVRMEGLAELVVASPGGRAYGSGGIRRSASDGMRQRLMLRGGGRDGRGCREVGALEVCGGEVGDALADGGPELGDGLLDLGRVVIRLRLVYFRNSA